MHFLYVARGVSDEPLYVGMTDDLHTRLNQHRRASPWYNSTQYIEYATCPTLVDLKIYEIYYINLLRPSYVRQSLTPTKPTITLQPLKFETFKPAGMSRPSREYRATQKASTPRRIDAHEILPTDVYLGDGTIDFNSLFFRAPADQRYFVETGTWIRIARHRRLTDTHIELLSMLISEGTPILLCKDDESDIWAVLDPYYQQVALPIASDRLSKDVQKLCLDLASNFMVTSYRKKHVLRWSLFSAVNQTVYINGWKQLSKYWDQDFLDSFVDAEGKSRFVSIVTTNSYGIADIIKSGYLK